MLNVVGQHYKAGVQILTARYTDSTWTTIKLITAVTFIHFTNNIKLSMSPRDWPASASITRRIITHPHKTPVEEWTNRHILSWKWHDMARHDMEHDGTVQRTKNSFVTLLNIKNSMVIRNHV